MGNILTYIGLAKHALPVIDAVVAEVKVLIPVEKADVAAAYEAVEKAVADLKDAFGKLVDAVKVAVANS